MARVYATDGDLITYGWPPDLVIPPPPESTRLLTRASQRVETATRSAIYATDTTTGLPTDQAVKDAMRDAVCAQVIHWRRTGDEAGDSGRWDSVTIGSVSLSGRKSTSDTSQAGAAGRVCEDAIDHLRAAGLAPGSIVTGGVERWW